MIDRIFCFLFGHAYPEYFHWTGSRAVDAMNTHHLYLHRSCMNCGKEQTAMVHVPQEYVAAYDKVRADAI